MIKDLIRLKWHAQLSHAQIATTLKISKGVVAKYGGLASEQMPTVTPARRVVRHPKPTSAERKAFI